MPKFLSILVSKSSPFSCPIIMTECPSKFARPAMDDLSSPNNRSPDKGKVLKKIINKKFRFWSLLVSGD